MSGLLGFALLFAPAVHTSSPGFKWSQRFLTVRLCQLLQVEAGCTAQRSPSSHAAPGHDCGYAAGSRRQGGVQLCARRARLRRCPYARAWRTRQARPLAHSIGRTLWCSPSAHRSRRCRRRRRVDLPRSTAAAPYNLLAAQKQPAPHACSEAQPSACCCSSAAGAAAFSAAQSASRAFRAWPCATAQPRHQARAQRWQQQQH
jgi:hypothetical protein